MRARRGGRICRKIGLERGDDRLATPTVPAFHRPRPAARRPHRPERVGARRRHFGLAARLPCRAKRQGRALSLRRRRPRRPDPARRGGCAGAAQGPGGRRALAQGGRGRILLVGEAEDRVAPNGAIALKDLSNERFLVFADAIAKSVALARDEREVNSVFDKVEPLANVLGRTAARCATAAKCCA